MKLGAMVAVSSFALSQVAAGQAVQWKVSEGGNGHWYRLDPQSRDWSAAQQFAVQQGGHLATLTTSAEDQSARQVLQLSSGYHWLGGFQTPSGCEPGCDWRWVTGEQWSFTNWGQGEPNAASGDEDYLESVPAGGWNDRDVGLRPSVIEWSADCNGDNIVDYGQCRDGSLPDYNGNNIPDCCEQGVVCTVGNYPAQWRVEDGGNGHWYQLMVPASALSWTAARGLAETRRGHLACAETAAEKSYFFTAFGASTKPSAYQGPRGPWLGGFQQPGATETTGGWFWVTGAPFNPAEVFCCNNGCGDTPEDRLHLYRQSAVQSWNDIPDNAEACGSPVKSYLIEWSADCNNDGIVDYGQILMGQLDDVDANGVPDLCEAYEVPSEFSTIQAAINAVPAGQYGLVLVAAGTYHESFSLNGKNVRVQGAANNATILDGTGLTTSIARFTGGEPATAGLANLVFRNGTAGSRTSPTATFTVGGAVYGIYSSVSITNCRFEQNRADYGGAVYLLYSSMNMSDCDFAGNIAENEGGGVLVYETSGSLAGCDFTQNACGVSGPGSGSGFKSVGARVAGETVLLSGCTFTGGIAGVDGSAVEHFENTANVRGKLRMVGCTVTGNASNLDAAGLRMTGAQASCVLTGGTTICSNTPRNVDGPFLIEGTATVCGCLADVTGDGQVNGGDLGIVLNSWGGADALGSGDVNHDGVINGSDLSIVLSSWGACGG